MSISLLESTSTVSGPNDLVSLAELNEGANRAAWSRLGLGGVPAAAAIGLAIAGMLIGAWTVLALALAALALAGWIVERFSPFEDRFQRKTSLKPEEARAGLLASAGSGPAWAEPGTEASEWVSSFIARACSPRASRLASGADRVATVLVAVAGLAVGLASLREYRANQVAGDFAIRYAPELDPVFAMIAPPGVMSAAGAPPAAVSTPPQSGPEQGPVLPQPPGVTPSLPAPRTVDADKAPSVVGDLLFRVLPEARHAAASSSAASRMIKMAYDDPSRAEAAISTVETAIRDLKTLAAEDLVPDDVRDKARKAADGLGRTARTLEKLKTNPSDPQAKKDLLKQIGETFNALKSAWEAIEKLIKALVDLFNSIFGGSSGSSGTGGGSSSSGGSSGSGGLSATMNGMGKAALSKALGVSRGTTSSTSAERSAFEDRLARELGDVVITIVGGDAPPVPAPSGGGTISTRQRRTGQSGGAFADENGQRKPDNGNARTKNRVTGRDEMPPIMPSGIR